MRTKLVALATFVTVAALALAPSVVAAQHDPGVPGHLNRPRWRLGVSGEGGAFAGATTAGFGGVSLRAGLQMSDFIAFYLQARGMAGAFADDVDRGRVVGLAYHSALAEITVGHVLQLGAGPSIDVIWGCDGVRQRACVGNGPYFGGDFRAALVLGTVGRVHRGGFSISATVHPTWLGEDVVIAGILGLGVELY